MIAASAPEASALRLRGKPAVARRADFQAYPEGAFAAGHLDRMPQKTDHRRTDRIGNSASRLGTRNDRTGFTQIRRNAGWQ